jgi:RHS repeat-associated protein
MKTYSSCLAGLVLLATALGRFTASANPSPAEAQIQAAAGVLYQPLVWTGTKPPPEEENQILASDLAEIKAHGLGAGMAALETFVNTHTNSAWAPSVRANLGRYYLNHGRYTDACTSWAAAWEATKGAPDGPGKQVADFAYAYWTKLLAGVGQVNALRPLLDEARDRNFDEATLRIIVNNTRSEYKLMVNNTDVSFRCGAYALNDVFRALKVPALDMAKVMHTPSPVTGFSLNKVVEMAGRAGVPMVAAEWDSKAVPAVPSVVHWKNNHYAAIMAERNGMFQVMDLVIGKPIWMSAADLQAEASGYFVVPKDKLPADWKLLTVNEADQIYGRGYVSGAPDNGDGCGNGSGGGSGGGNGNGNGNGTGNSGNGNGNSTIVGGGGGSAPVAATPGGPVGSPSCKGSCSGSGSSGSGGTGGSGSGCCNSQGMPVWEVSEPCINIWLYDQPLGYQPSLGASIAFKLAYKQRDSEAYGVPRTISPNIFSLGNNWNCSWISYVEDDGSGNTATMFVAGGGVRTYQLDNSTKEYYSHTTMQRTTDPVTGNLTGFIISYANGAQDFYQEVPSEELEGYQVALLTSKVDQFGHVTRFTYQDTNNVCTLKYLVDVDGRTNTLFYTNQNPSLITGVRDPFGHSATMQYDSNGMLTNITDVVGMSSSFRYDSQNWVTNLTTPYGTTLFQQANASDDWTDPVFGDYTLVRGVTVVDAAGGTNVYMLRQDSSQVFAGGTNQVPFLMYLYSTNEVEDDADVPVNTPVPVDNNYQYYRNTFHWGPRQAVGLPADLTTFAPSDYIKARMRHWLHDGVTGNLGQTLDMEQAPSPDGLVCGQSTWYAYDGQNGYVYEGSDSQPAQIARVLPDGTTWYTWYQRDDWGRATNVVDTFSTSFGATPQTRTNVYVYDANEVNLIQQVGPLGETTSYGYDNNNQLLFVTNALNEVTSYTWDAQGRLTSATTPAGLTTTNIYYNNGTGLNFLQTTIDIQIRRTNSYTYANDLVFSHKDERGLTTVNNWDALNRLLSTTYPDGTSVTYSYNRLDLAQVWDRLGFTKFYAYDSLRRMIYAGDELGRQTFYNYCTCGALESIKDPAGNFTTFTYDNAGDRLTVTYADNYSIYYTYDLPGRVVSTVDSGGVASTNWYVNQGLPYAVSNAVGQASVLSFDADNRVTNSVDANNVSVGIAYDLLGRTLSRSYPDGGVEAYGYTFGISGPTSYTDQIGVVTFYTYDAARRKIAQRNALNNVTLFNYAPAGDLLALTDGNGSITSWGYDIYGRVANKLDAAGNVVFRYNYDPDSRLRTRWSAAKGNTIYSYDAVGNLTNVVYPVNPAVALKFDGLNRLTNMVDALGATVYGYNTVGQLLSEDGPWGNDMVSYTYQNRLLTGMNVQAPVGASWTQSYAYDQARRLTGIISPAGAFGYGYDPVELQRVDELTLPNQASIVNSYDNVARLTGTWLKNSTGTDLDSYVYTYNQANQRTKVVRTAGDYVNYLYDGIGELTNAMGREPSSFVRLPERLNYKYDAAGNLLQKRQNAVVVTALTNGYNNLNELTTTYAGGVPNSLSGWSYFIPVSGSTTSPATNVIVNGSSTTPYGDNTYGYNVSLNPGNNAITVQAQDVYGRSSAASSSVFLVQSNGAYAYDLNGNLLTDGTRYFAYDDENQLISVWKTNAWRNDFVYDGKMRRRIERDFAWNGSAWSQTNEIHFVYDGNLVVQERDINNLPQVTYTRGKDLSGSLQGAGGIGGLLARTDKAQAIPAILQFGGGSPQFVNHSYYHADGNGNVTMLLSSSQMILAKYLYDPFGNTLAQCGLLADINKYRFSSKEWNANSGLYYYLYRFYDPNLQRWLNRDPLADNGSNIGSAPAEFIEGADLYEFVGDDAINGGDYFGLATFFPSPKRFPGWRGVSGGIGAILGAGGGYVMAHCPDWTCHQGSCQACCAGGLAAAYAGILAGVAALEGSGWGFWLGITGGVAGAAAAADGYKSCMDGCAKKAP